MPFIIRGVSLLGVASAGTPAAYATISGGIWPTTGNRGTWRPFAGGKTTLEGLPEVFNGMLSGQSFGRTVVKTGKREPSHAR